MKILVVGAGSIGQRHVSIFKKVDPHSQIAVLRQHFKSSQLGATSAFIDNVFYDIADAVAWRPQAVVIANPAPWHVSVAVVFAEQGCDVFIEKPLAVSLEGVDELIKICHEKQLIGMVGYVLRFLEPLRFMKDFIDQGRLGEIRSISGRVGRYLPDWRPGTDYHQNVSARRELGGGVIFELSHELDYLQWINGDISAVMAMSGTIGDFGIDVEDIAEISVQFANGSFGHVHLDMLDHAAGRSCRIIGSKGTLIWNFETQHQVQFITHKLKEDVFPLTTIDRDEMFIQQAKHFLQCIENRQQPLVSLENGKKTLMVALAAHQSVQQRKIIS